VLEELLQMILGLSEEERTQVIQLIQTMQEKKRPKCVHCAQPLSENAVRFDYCFSCDHGQSP
jgi:hypothetical protein